MNHIEAHRDLKELETALARVDRENRHHSSLAKMGSTAVAYGTPKQEGNG